MVDSMTEAAAGTQGEHHAASPTGRAVTLRGGGYEAVVVEVGAGLRSLRRDGVDVVAGYAATEAASAGRGQQLLPWPNRVADGRYTFDGAAHQLALTEPPARNAIHGLTRWSSWALFEEPPSRVRCRHRLHPQPGYPYLLDLEVVYEVGPAGLAVQTTARNVGATAAPYGHGFHPYLTVGRRVDDCELTVPASTWTQTDDRGLPVATAEVDPEHDLRRPRLLGSLVLDHPFGELSRGPDGLAQATLRDPDTGRTATVWADASYRYLQLFTGEPLGAAAREAVAVEPMTCPPDAFNSGIDLVVLGPGEQHVGRLGLR